MRSFTMVILSCCLSVSMFGGSPSDEVLQAALDEVSTVLSGTITDRTRGLAPEEFVIAKETVGCDEPFLAEWLDGRYGTVIVDEILDAYRGARSGNAGIGDGFAADFPILALSELEIGEERYDWERMRSLHPSIRGVVRLSLPAVETQGVIGIVHYEVLTEKGRAYGNFHIFEKQGDGSWRMGEGVTGWVRVPERGEAERTRARDDGAAGTSGR